MLSGALASPGILSSQSIAADSVSPVSRSTPLARQPERAPGFTRLEPAQTGIQFTNRLSLKQVAENRLIEDGSGVAAGDVDGDGLCDLYFCSLAGTNRLFRNLGNLRFEDITAKTGTECRGQASTGAVFADIEGDGDLDLLVSGLGTGTRLFLNDGRGRFVEKTDAGLLRKFGARTLACADIDGDGDLDLYVANYRTTTARDEGQRLRITRRGNRFEVPPEFRDRFAVAVTDQGRPIPIELGEPDVLYRNLGNGTFEPVSWTDGEFRDEHGRILTEPPRDWGLSAMFRDLNGDGAPDLYVCNDFYSPDRLWLNRGQGQFQAAPSTALRKTSFSSMAVDFADIDRDDLDDFFVADMLGMTRLRRQTQRDNIEEFSLPNLGWGWHIGQVTNVTQVMRNTLFLNLGGGRFAEMAYYSGLHASDWTWGTAFLDVDLDGYEDLLIANGHARDHLNSDVQALLAPAGPPANAAARERLFSMIPSLAVPKRAFRNRGNLTFEDRSAEWGFDWVGISPGMALADLDQDGDLDVVLNNLNAGALVMRNDTTAPRIAIRLHGRSPNTAGIGAKVRVKGGPVPQSQEFICGGRYLSSDESLRVFGAGHLTNRLSIEVTWRSGQRTVVTNAAPNRIYEIGEASADRETGVEALKNRSVEALSRTTDHGSRSDAPALFEDVSDRLNGIHEKDEFDDYSRQPLLPRRLSQNGPGVSWLDLNADGHDDLVLGAGHSKRSLVWLNDGAGKLTPAQVPGVLTPNLGDQTTLLCWASTPGNCIFLGGFSSHELPTPAPASVIVYDVSSAGARAIQGLPAGANVGPMAAADIDGDHDLDLFVGGYAQPGRYPLAERSILFRQMEGRFSEDTENTRRLAEIGLVNGATWSDVDGDGDSDLLLACEWGPIRILRNEGGVLTDWNAPIRWADPTPLNYQLSTLNQLSGWWNGIAAGDFNEDGRMDILASNWGQNTKYQEFLGRGIRLYYGDLDGNGVWDLIETYWDPALKKEMPWCDYRLMRRAAPSFLERLSTYAAYGSASVEEIFGEALKRAWWLKINTLESILLLNAGQHFEARPLPLQAQLSPAFAIAVADFDGDGHEDAFLSQNSFAVDRESGCLDAGCGLWLRGDGAGSFRSVPPLESGLVIEGEQRGAAAADFDNDGRTDLVVAQHAAPLKLLRNRGARVGLRVRLEGPPGNLNGFGAQVRLRFGEHYGAVREIHAGSGYWSQNSSVAVLGKSAEPSHLWVRWPGGKVTESVVPSGVTEVSVDQAGRLKVLRQGFR